MRSVQAICAETDDEVASRQRPIDILRAQVTETRNDAPLMDPATAAAYEYTAREREIAWRRGTRRRRTATH